jgi:hypothetical protein
MVMVKAQKSGIDRSKLYTSSQVREMLDISGSTLKNLVERNIIERVVPRGYKQGFYSKESVDDYARSQELFTETYRAKKSGHLIVRQALRSDQTSIYEMEKRVLGATTPLDKRLEWCIANPYIDFVALSDGEAVGHLSLLPLTEPTLVALLKGEIRGWHVAAEDIEPYQPGKQYRLFVMAMAVTSTIYAALLLREAQQFIFELADKEIVIKGIYATSRTRDGIYFAHRIGMHVLKEYSTPHKLSFELDMKRSDARWTRDYRNYLSSLDLPATLTQGILDKEPTI